MHINIMRMHAMQSTRRFFLLFSSLVHVLIKATRLCLASESKTTTFGHISLTRTRKVQSRGFFGGAVAWIAELRCRQIQCPRSGSVNEPRLRGIPLLPLILIAQQMPAADLCSPRPLAHRVHRGNVNRRLLNLTRRIFLRNINKRP